MIHLHETLALHSIEDFLSPAELSQLTKIVDNEAPEMPESPGMHAAYPQAPALAQDILHAAVERVLPSIQRMLPSVVADAPWIYAELTEGQSIAAHLDGIPDPGVPPRRVGRLSVVLEAPQAGGEFYVETTDSATVWTGAVVGEQQGFAPRTPLTRHLPIDNDHGAEADWLQEIRRTRWTADAQPGVGIAYGAQIIHGVLPVRTGRLRKFVTDLLDVPA